MAGVRDLLPIMQGVLASQWTITGPATALQTVRIAGSNDPAIGSVKWTPPQTGQPFAVIYAEGADDAVVETNRVWGTYQIRLALGIEHADTPLVNENYNDLALAWIESARQVVASNRRLGGSGAVLYPTAGDVRWDMHKGTIMQHMVLFGTPWYGVEIQTKLSVTFAVQFQG